MAFPNCSHVSATDTSRPTGADYIYCLAKEVRKLKESIAAGNGVFDVLAANVIEPLPTGPCDLYWNNVVLAMHFDDVTEYHASGYIGEPWYTTKVDACSLGADVAYAGSKYGRHNVGEDTCEVFNDAGYTSLFTTWTYATRSSIVDEKGHTVTAVGNAQITTAGKFNQAGLFDGAGDYLTLADSADWDFGVGNWTIEAFVYVTDITHPNVIVCQANNTFPVYPFKFYVESTGKLGAAIFAPSLDTCYDTVNFPINEWVHVALVRDGAFVNLYKNGVQVAQMTGIGDALVTSSTELYIGTYATNDYFGGKIDDLLMYKGVAKYTASFTPPTAPFAEVACYAADTSWVSSTLAVANNARGIGTNGSVFAVAHQTGSGECSVGSPTSWSSVGLGASIYWRDIAASGSTLCAIGVPSSGIGTYSSISTDNGANWTTAADLPVSASWVSIAGSPTAFVAVGDSNLARRLTAGSWASVSSTHVNAAWYSITYADGKFIAVAPAPSAVTQAYIAVSTDDGVTFTDSSFGSIDIRGVGYNGAVWCVVATNGAIYTSPTGLAGSWTAQRAADGTLTYSVAALDGVFYSPVYNSDQCLYSVDDGMTWLSFTLPTTGLWIDCCSDGTRVVAIGGSTTVSTS